MNPEEGTAVMDAIFQTLTVFNRTPDLILDEEVSATVYDGIIPCLQFYMTLHAPELLPRNKKKLIPVFEVLKEFKQISFKKGMISEDQVMSVSQQSSYTLRISACCDIATTMPPF